MQEYQYVTTNECCAGSCAGNCTGSCAGNGPARAETQKAAGVQMKCSTYGALAIPAGTDVGTTFPLVNLNVNTQDYKKPCIKVEFLSNIITDAATVTLNFQVFRQCNGQLTPVPAGAVWTFSRTAATSSGADTFGFTLCDCDSCNGSCCNYSVVATVVGAATVGTVTVNNATLMATVVEDADC